MRVKKIFMVCLCLLCMFSVIPAYASSDIRSVEENADIVQSRFTNVDSFYNDFNISDKGKATITSSIIARNVDEIKISTYLQKYKSGRWTTVKQWTTTESGTIAVLGESWYVASGNQYRMVSYGYVYKNNELLESTTYTSDTEIY